MTKKIIYLALTLGLLMYNENESKSRNKSNAKKLGWGTKYNNSNPYPGSVKYDENKEYVGLNYDLIFDGKEYSKIRRKTRNVFFLNPLGNLKNIAHYKYSPNILNLKKGDIITGIQFRIHTGFKNFFLNDPSGNREWSTPSNFESTGYKISLGNSKNLEMNKDYDINKNYDTNIKQTDDFKLVKQGVKWEDKEWPFGKIPLNDFGPILKFDQEFTYQGDALFLEIYYPDQKSLEKIETYTQGFSINEGISQNSYFSYIDKKFILSANGVLDIQFEVIRK